MARVTLIIFLLSSVTGIEAGMRHTTQVHNVTRMEKRAPMMEVGFDCNTATYKTVTLVDFVYTHKCFPAGWGEFLALDKVKKDISEISPELFKDAQKKQIEPPMPNMFKAFNVRRDNVRVVILGQDPTPQANQATGMAFSLKPGVDPRTVPSVLNMLVELRWEGIDVGLTNGDLSPWVGQGVLLLNAALTVRQGGGNAGTHQGLWSRFTELLLEDISKNGPSSAWILWGNEAKAFAGYIDTSRHYIKTGGHPSPQGAAGFFGGNYFLCANRFLNEIAKRGGVDDWRLKPSFVSPLEQCKLPGE